MKVLNLGKGSDYNSYHFVISCLILEKFNCLRIFWVKSQIEEYTGVDLGGECRGAPPPRDEAFFFLFAFKFCLPHQSVMPFPSGAPPPKKNPGSTPDICGYVGQ